MYFPLTKDKYYFADVDVTITCPQKDNTRKNSFYNILGNIYSLCLLMYIMAYLASRRLELGCNFA